MEKELGNHSDGDPEETEETEGSNQGSISSGGGSPEKLELIEKRKYIYLDMGYTCGERLISKIWLQTDKLEIQVKVMGAVSSPKIYRSGPAGWKFR